VQQVRRFADNLRDQPLSTLPITLALAPKGYQVAFLEIDGPAEFYYCLAPAASLAEPQAYVCVRRNPQAQDPPGRPVRVGADNGEISTADGIIRLAVHRPGFEFAVSERDHGVLSEADLIRFAAGVTQRS
jgi:hypothetical protein